MDNFLKDINVALSLRPPQRESLEIFARLTEILSLEKNCNLESELEKVKKFFSTVQSFEREFPSVCFSLATGIGKTRLMGACIAYLHYTKNIKNFFVIAPNLTIYKKLKYDLGNSENPKYVFHGLEKFATPPRIIDGDNYGNFRALSLDTSNDIIINVFNISKLNSDSKVDEDKPARIKRFNEILGESYFEYLKNLPDLCIFMDESHHYHADKSFEVINELKPILGVEFTATPKFQKNGRAVLFKNVVYEYSLAQALKDEQFVKTPVVVTRQNFNPDELKTETKTESADESKIDPIDEKKLFDGVKLHETLKPNLEIYARKNNLPVVKPFVLVVAKDTTHSANLLDYIKSENFFEGSYADKVIEVNSTQRGEEKDTNIELLLSLEKPENKIEIVIHVNMLKEGWDVTNLYTIVPLRASASEILTEQTIGRGLRLPYGKRIGDEELDRLSIVSHDKYEEIIALANDENSLVKKISYIEDICGDDDTTEKEVVEMPSIYDSLTQSENFISQIALNLQEENKKSETPRTDEDSKKIAKFLSEKIPTSVINLNEQVKNFNEVNSSDIQKNLTNSIVKETVEKFSNLNLRDDEIQKVVEKTVETCVQNLIEKVIPIPQIKILPSTTNNQKIFMFELNTEKIHWYPSSDNILQGHELKDGGKDFEIKVADDTETKIFSIEEIKNRIVKQVTQHDNINHNEVADLVFALVQNAEDYFKSYLGSEKAEKVLREKQNSLAEEIYSQILQHFFKEKISLTVEKILPFQKILPSFVGKVKKDKLYDLNATMPASEVPKKIFQGFKKSCTTLCKFDSDAERKFVKILESEIETDVLKWLRPAANQFDIRYDVKNFSSYEPDFVVETTEKIYLVEIKGRNNLQNEDVEKKAKAAKVFCETATKYNLENGGKAWQYILLVADKIILGNKFQYLVNTAENI